MNQVWGGEIASNELGSGTGMILLEPVYKFSKIRTGQSPLWSWTDKHGISAFSILLTLRRKDVYMQSMRSFKPYVEFRLTKSTIELKAASGEIRKIEITPGSSFGAEHPTTRLCIMGLEEIFRERTVRTVLDFGCGSGVLGICAASLGAESVLAVDIDPTAVKEAEANFAKNKLDPIGRVQYGSMEDVGGRFDLVIANIVTEDLLTMVDWFRSVLKDQGIVLVSGIYDIREEALADAYVKAGFRVNKAYRESGWVAIWIDIE